MTSGSTNETSHSWSCNRARRRRRRRQRADDLLEQLGLGAGVFYWDGGNGTDDQYSEEAQGSRSAARIEELEKTVETMSETITVLAERVKVLERIVVDDEANIAREINKLKDSGAAK